MSISYDWYKIFEAVASCGNITAAAERLYISQPAVSQSIKQLEAALGCVLFIRTGRGVRLTAEGEVLHRYAARGLEQIRLGEKQLEALLNMERGEVRIGASDMTLKYYLLPYLEKYHQKFRISK
jgi:DNA-binding transcriptional LysR family regulator